MQPQTLDHVAFWVADRQGIVDFVERYLGMHVIVAEEAFTLMGADARRGKLTLFDAEGHREPGPLDHVALRVSDLRAARELLPPGTPEVFEVGDGIRIELVEGDTDVDYDLDHVALHAGDPLETARAYQRYGFEPAGPARVVVGGAFIELHEGTVTATDRPLLNHLAVLVDSADEVLAEAADLDIEVDSVVDGPNTYAAFLVGPERVRIEYVEHKPTFSLT